MLLKVQKVFEQKVDMQEITIDHMQRGRTSVNAPRLVLEVWGDSCWPDPAVFEIAMLSLLRGSDGTKYNVNTTSVLLAALLAPLILQYNQQYNLLHYSITHLHAHLSLSVCIMARLFVPHNHHLTTTTFSIDQNCVWR